MSSPTPKQSLSIARLIVRRSKAWLAIRKLMGAPSSKLRAIGRALLDSQQDRFDSAERHVIKQIEQRRSSLLDCDDTIQLVDYGAGSPTSARSAQEMHDGVLSSAKIADVCGASSPEFWAKFLYRLVREIEPNSCIELGTCLGISASYQASALRLTGRGHLTTLEGSPEVAMVAKQTLDLLNLKNAEVITGPFHTTLNEALEASRPVDYFFNDGHHDRNAVLQYFETSFPYLNNEAIVVFDDISWSPGMRSAWVTIENDPRVAASIDLHKIGIALVRSSNQQKLKVRVPLESTSRRSA